MAGISGLLSIICFCWLLGGIDSSTPCYFCNDTTNAGFSIKVPPISTSHLLGFGQGSFDIMDIDTTDLSFSVYACGGAVAISNSDASYQDNYTIIQAVLNNPNPNANHITAQVGPYGKVLGEVIHFPACSDCRAPTTYVTSNAAGVAFIGFQFDRGEFGIDVVIQNSTGTSLFRFIDSLTTPYKTPGSGRLYFSVVHSTYYGRIGTQGFPPRYDTAGSLIIFGGYSGISNLNDVWAFHFSTETWEILHTGAGYAPSKRRSPLAAMIGNDKMVLFGGTSTESTSPPIQILTDVWVFDLVTKNWTAIAPHGSDSVLTRIYGSMFATTYGTVVLHGGYYTTPGGEPVVTNQMYELDIDFSSTTYQWSPLCEVRSLLNTPRFFHTFRRITDNFALLYGGFYQSVQLSAPLFYDYDERSTYYCPSYKFCTNRRTCNGKIITPVCNDTAHPYACVDGHCYANPNQCSLVTSCTGYFGFQCWNGKCARNPSECDPFPRCSVGLQRCYDGTCASSCTAPKPTCSLCESTCLPSCCLSDCTSTESYGSSNWMSECCLSEQTSNCCPFNSTCCSSCNSVPAKLCINGCQKESRYDCIPYDGCPAPLFQCPTGKCATSLTECECIELRTGDTGYLCYGGSCQNSMNCPSNPPIWKEYQPGALIPNNVVGNFYYGPVILSLVSNNGLQFSIDFPSEDSISMYNFSQWSKKPAFIFNDVGYYENILSPVVRVSLIDCCDTTYSFTLYVLKAVNDPNVCLAILGTNGWTCLQSTSITNGNNAYVGSPMTSNLLRDFRAYRSAVFAVIRSSWRSKAYAQDIFNYLRYYPTSLDFVYAGETVSAPAYNYTKLQVCRSLESGDHLNTSVILSSTAQWLYQQFQLPSSQIQFSFTLTSNASLFPELWDICFRLADSAFPPPPPPTPAPAPVPSPSTEILDSQGLDSASYLYIGIGIGSFLVLLCIIGCTMYCVKNQLEKDKKPKKPVPSVKSMNTVTRGGGGVVKPAPLQPRRVEPVVQPRPAFEESHHSEDRDAFAMQVMGNGEEKKDTELVGSEPDPLLPHKEENEEFFLKNSQHDVHVNVEENPNVPETHDTYDTNHDTYTIPNNDLTGDDIPVIAPTDETPSEPQGFILDPSIMFN